MSVTRKSITIEVNGQEVELNREDAIEVYNIICQSYGIFPVLTTCALPKEPFVRLPGSVD